MPQPITRRRLLTCTVGVGALGTAAACGSGDLPSTRNTPPLAVPAGPDFPVTRREVVYSRHRREQVALDIHYPKHLTDRRHLPVAVYLHGRNGRHPTPIPFETLSALEIAYRDGGAAPFAIVTLDGGTNAHWYDGSTNGDAVSMLVNELPEWLAERDLAGPDGLPFACAGISTGGVGALRYAAARNHLGKPLSAVGVLAPALWVDWEQMGHKDSFTSQQTWEDANPLSQLADLGDVPIGIWVGDEDPYLEGARILFDGHPNTPIFSVLPGGHDGTVFDAVGTDMIRFLASALTHHQNS